MGSFLKQREKLNTNFMTKAIKHYQKEALFVKYIVDM